MYRSLDVWALPVADARKTEKGREGRGRRLPFLVRGSTVRLILILLRSHTSPHNHHLCPFSPNLSSLRKANTRGSQFFNPPA